MLTLERPSSTRRSPILLCALALAAGAHVARAAPAAPQGRTVAIASGDFVDTSSVSDDGRWLAFSSLTDGLVPDDGNGLPDCFLLDRETASITWLSRMSGPSCTDPRISLDGDVVVFSQDKDALLLWQRATGQATVIAAHGASDPDVTPDGRFIVYAGMAPRHPVIGDPIGIRDIFVHDRTTGVVERVSVATDGTHANDHSWSPTITPDGRYVAFMSAASNLVPLDTNGTAYEGQGDVEYLHGSDMFVRDRLAATTERVSVSSKGREADSGSFAWPGERSISDDGRFVAFYGQSQNLVPEDAANTATTYQPTFACESTMFLAGMHLDPPARGGDLDVFVRDRLRGTTERVSVSSDGREAGNIIGHSFRAALSRDGRYVSFVSTSPHIAPSDADGCAFDVFRHDRVDGSVEHVSTPSGGFASDRPAYLDGMSRNGRHVLFQSRATDDLAAGGDLYARDLGPALGAGQTEVRVGDQGMTVSGWFRAAGRTVSSADDAVGDVLIGLAPMGADIDAAELIHRPELADLLLRIQLTDLPTIQVPAYSSGAGMGTIVYRASFTVDATRYEIVGSRMIGEESVRVSTFSLRDCTSSCQEIGLLEGSIGTTGNAVLVAVPLAAVGASAGTAIRAFDVTTALRIEDVTATEVDVVTLPDAALTAVEIDVAVSRSGDEPTLFVPAATAGGTFTATFTASDEPPEARTVWVRTRFAGSEALSSTNL